MRPLREDERDEIEAIKHLIKYTISKPNIETYKILDALKQLEEISKKYVLSGIVAEEELDELLEIDDLKEVINKFLSRLAVECLKSN